MKPGPSKLWRLALALLPVFGILQAQATTPAELRQLLESHARVTLVDIREESFYRSAHIPGAINIPERVVALKRLPPLGRVIAYGRGLSTDNVAEAVRLLNAKGGIQATALEGGYAAWETERGVTTKAPGLQEESLDFIAYQDLQKMAGDADVVLVDLRKTPQAPTGEQPQSRQGVRPPAPAVTPLESSFPGMRVVKSPFDIGAVAQRGAENGGRQQRMAATSEKVPVMVLIDNGDGEARKMARTLRANGINRVVILAGGEKILERGGAPGLRRQGVDSSVVKNNDANNQY